MSIGRHALVRTSRVLLLLVLLLAVVLLVACGLAPAREGFGQGTGSLARAFPGRCFDCEKQMRPGYEWMAQPTKCFDCEREARGERGGWAAAAQRSHPNRCYACEAAEVAAAAAAAKGGG